MTAVLPLISPEKGAQLGFVAQGMLLVVSGVYYPVEVLPAVDAVARDDLARDLRARGDPRRDPRRRRRLSSMWPQIWPLLVIGAASHPARARDLQPRRGVREAPRQAEAVGMTTIRPARVATADLHAYVELWNTVTPDEASTVEQQRKRRERDRRRLYVVAEHERRDRRLRVRGAVEHAGSRLPRTAGAARSPAARASGAALLRELAAHLATLEFVSMSSHVDGADPRLARLRRATRVRGGRPAGRAGEGHRRGAGRRRLPTASRSPRWPSVPSFYG